jgi:hypothetical protein
MTMMTHIHGSLARTARPSDARAAEGSQGAAHLSAIKRFLSGVLTVLVATAMAAGAIALKSVYFLSHFSY